MARFIKLEERRENHEGCLPLYREVLINVNQIESVYGYSDGAEVRLISGEGIEVAQTFEEVQALLNDNPELLNP